MSFGPDTLDAGDGLILRHFTLEDAAAIFAAVEENREHLRTYLPWVDRTRTVADVFDFLLRTGVDRPARQTLAYGLWQDGELVGAIGTHDADAVDKHLSIGYWIRKESSGRGIVTRACRRLIRYAFEDQEMERIEIRMAPGNQRSAAIPVRLGFRLEGTLRHAQKLTDGYTDLRVYSLLRDEFLAEWQEQLS